MARLKLPEGYQVESFRGARFPALTEVVKNLDLPDEVTDIVIAAGINDRDADPEREPFPTVATCIAALRKTARQIHYLEVSIPNSFIEKQRGNVERLNDYMKSRSRDIGIIEACQGHKVKTLSDGLHYTDSTLSDISGKISNYFLN